MSRLLGVTGRKVREQFSGLKFESTPVERESTPMVGRSTPKKARVDSQRYIKKKSESISWTLRFESTPAIHESTPRLRDHQQTEDQVTASEIRVDSQTARVDSTIASRQKAEDQLSETESRVDSEEVRVDSKTG